MSQATTTRRSLRAAVAFAIAALTVTACGEDGTDTATDPSPAAAETTTTTAEPTTTERITTNTTAETTTTEPPVPGFGLVSGDSIEDLSAAVGADSPVIEGVDYLTAEQFNWSSGTPRAVLFAPLADWCPHCSVHLEQLGNHLKENGTPTSATVLLVTSEEQPSAQYPQDEWLTGAGWTYSTTIEPDDFSISTAFGVTSVPTWFLVGSDGVIVDVVDGHHVSPEDIFAMIDALE